MPSTCPPNAGAEALLHPASSPSLPDPSERLRHLFRLSARQGHIHPLQRVLRAHRGDDGPEPTSPPPALSSGSTVAPRSIGMAEVKRRVADLPPLPRAAVRALKTLQRDDASLEEVAADLSCDASLTARVLRLANSPFYGVPGRVSTARDAAQVLGRRTLESVLRLAAVAGQFADSRSQTFDTAAFWRHALATAIAARALGRVAGCDEDECFVAGLLHDIGLLAMSVYFGDELDQLIACARSADIDLCSVEQRHVLTSHALIGSWIAEHWHFPAAVVQAIATHHAPPATEGRSRATVADCVHVGNAVGHALDVAGLDSELVPPIDLAAWRRLALDDQALHQCFEQVEAGVHALCSALAL